MWCDMNNIYVMHENMPDLTCASAVLVIDVHADVLQACVNPKSGRYTVTDEPLHKRQL